MSRFLPRHVRVVVLPVLLLFAVGMSAVWAFAPTNPCPVRAQRVLWQSGEMHSEVRTRCEGLLSPISANVLQRSIAQTERTTTILHQEKPLTDALSEVLPAAEFVLVDLPTGHVRALGNPRENWAKPASPGAWALPLLYAAGLDAGLTPATQMSTLPSHALSPSQYAFIAVNERNNADAQQTTIAEALQNQEATAAVRVAQFVGHRPLTEYMRGFGLRGAYVTHHPVTDANRQTGTATWPAIVQAYSALARGGQFAALCWTQDCTVRGAALLSEPNPLQSLHHGQVVGAGAAGAISQLLRDDTGIAAWTGDWDGTTAHIMWDQRSLLAVRGAVTQQQLTDAFAHAAGDTISITPITTGTAIMADAIAEAPSAHPTKATRLINEGAFHREYRLGTSDPNAHFASQVAVDWVMDGAFVGHGAFLTWRMTPGPHTLRAELGDEYDTVSFVVWRDE